jgi:hypothetical protein
MATVPVPGSTERINQVLEALYRAHGVESVRQGAVVLFPAQPGLWANGEAFDHGSLAGQVDVRLGIDPERTLCESFAGIGDDLDQRTDDGLVAFTRCSFHVLLSAFFGSPPNDHAEREEWMIGGTPRDVFLGNVTSRFGLPPGADGGPDLRFFGHFRQQLNAQPLPPGTHWVRLYQMRFREESMCNEVLLDNGAWPAMQEAMAAFDWPLSDKPYDVRLFLVIRDLEDQFRCGRPNH